MLSTLQDEWRRAKARGVALAACNVYNLEEARGVIQAAEAGRSPVYLQVNSKTLTAVGLRPLARFLLALAEEASVPVAVHLDHGRSAEEIAAAIGAGFTSVMIDGSSLPFSENVALTRAVVRMAHAAGVPVEGELGAVHGDEDVAKTFCQEKPEFFTDPGLAGRFVRATDVDLLAVSVGNVHGAYRGEPSLDFQRLAAIQAATAVPLVLHGASGLSADDLREARARGVVKVNFNTDLRGAYVYALADWLATEGAQYNLHLLGERLSQTVGIVVSERLAWLSSTGAMPGQRDWGVFDDPDQ